MKKNNLLKLKRSLALFLVCFLILGETRFGLAQEEIFLPEPPAAEEVLTPPPQPSPPLSLEISSTEIPQPVLSPTTFLSVDEPKEQDETINEPISETIDGEGAIGEETTEEEDVLVITPSPEPTTVLNGEIIEGQVGEAVVVTEDATNSVVVINAGNLNQNETSDENEENLVADESLIATESASLNSKTETQSIQENNVEVISVLEQTTTTGGNSVSNNVGDSSIQTGNANTVGTVITALNTNLDKVSLVEQNIVGEVKGDLILDLGQNNLENNEGIDFNEEEISQSESFQTNEAILENTLVLTSDSGQNQANLNTKGDSSIQTGDANVAATVLTFLNNNLAGKVAVGIINIFGTLVGDIVLPGEISENENPVPYDNQGNFSANFQTNEATIENNLSLIANTGENEGKDNTGGQTIIETGEAVVEAKVVNVANNNFAGGSWWIVLVNQLGEWIGKIMGEPEGTNFAVAQEMNFKENEEGEIIVNQATSNELSTQAEQVQTNQVKITNNLELTANTGQNQVNKNTGGDSIIKTGNARIVANLFNFVNNNLSSQDKIIVAVINVFGRWIGNLFPPGVEKESSFSPTPEPTVIPTTQPSPEPSPNFPQEIEEQEASWSEPVGEEEVETEEEFWFEEEVPAKTESLISPFPRQIVAGLSLENQNNQEDSLPPPFSSSSAPSPIRINLAWLLVALPLLILTYRLRKLFF